MARTDDDSWDLATSVGATATMVAAGRARATRAGLIEDRFAEPLVRAVGIDFFTRWATGELDAADIDIPDHPWGMQPMTNLLAVRTRYIDTFLDEAAAAGIRQTVILASGLDARGYRLSWPADMTLFEIDQPAVLAFKATTLTALGAQPTVELRTVPVDLRHDWPSALQAAGFDAAQPTAWVAEGLLAFLPPDAQDRLLDNITELSADGSRLFAEMFLQTPDSQQAMQAANQRWYQHGLQVHLDGLGYPGERNDLVTYLDDRGWCTTRTYFSQLLADAGLPVPTPGDSAAKANENHYCTAILTQRPHT
ncbi:class I SAM-dependent methyltransferase [Mycobacterium talmoniae]|uniref:S-adenosyl-L-methionine-dependent methyltransferase n=1 Tax=Mycobacterium talmoniae TaxID=1858794 RepID=A0A1S1NGF3_9MYCO|nr:class I SAM-dependent methyltransferase [Mycobacterium talmoniae]OHV01555.1 SAM-dependent methyltransferase [Mycobacterium talmoniae]